MGQVEHFITHHVFFNVAFHPATLQFRKFQKTICRKLRKIPILRSAKCLKACDECTIGLLELWDVLTLIIINTLPEQENVHAQ